MTAPVPVVKVRSLLVTFDYIPGRNSYQAASCQLVADVGHLLLTRLGRLQTEGHPAWKTVDPTDLPAGWQVSDCVLQGLDAAYPFVCRRPDGSEVSEAGGGAGAERALRQPGLRPDRLLTRDFTREINSSALILEEINLR